MGRQPISAFLARSMVRVTGPIAVASLALVACGEPSEAAPETTVEVTTPPTRLIEVAAPTTTAVPVDSDLVQGCIEWVQFGVYSGNAIALAMWDNAAQDLRNLSLDCEYLGRSDPAALAELARQWAEIEAFLEGATTPVDDSTVTVP